MAIQIDHSEIKQCFSANYAQSKQRFVDACVNRGFRHVPLVLDPLGPNGEELSIDIAVAGNESPELALVVSSGLHGVEAPLGAAVQLSFMRRLPLDWQPPPGVAIVLIHALNPYGFAWNRRFNEENVDLNRNFLLAHESYQGAPPLAAAFQRVLGPKRRPSRLGSSTLRMGYLAARHGRQSFWKTLPVGQYEMPDWIFYGGRELAQTGRLLRDKLPELLASAREVIHFDFHTGLGRSAICELLLSEDEDPHEVAWWKGSFPDETVVASHGISRYAVRGGFGPWLSDLMPDCHYHFATAEFGTYSAMRMLKALAEESRSTSHNAKLPADHWSRYRLAASFNPKNLRWQSKCLATGLGLVCRAEKLLCV